jgi:hypothetical protein
MNDFGQKSDEKYKLNRDISEYKSDLTKLKVAELLIHEPDTAICIRIALGNDQFFEYWIDKNTHLADCLEREETLIRGLLIDAQEALRVL